MTPMYLEGEGYLSQNADTVYVHVYIHVHRSVTDVFKFAAEKWYISDQEKVETFENGNVYYWKVWVVINYDWW